MTNRKWMAALAAPLALAVLMAGPACGGDDDSTSAKTATTAASAAAGGDKTIPEGAPVMDQEGLAFKPNKLTVKAGDKVYVKNSETAIHTFNVNNKNVSGNMKKGDVYVYTAAEKGTFKITCDYHPQMNGTLTVE